MDNNKDVNEILSSIDNIEVKDATQAVARTATPPQASQESKVSFEEDITPIETDTSPSNKWDELLKIDTTTWDDLPNGKYVVEVNGIDFSYTPNGREIANIIYKVVDQSTANGRTQKQTFFLFTQTNQTNQVAYKQLCSLIYQFANAKTVESKKEIQQNLILPIIKRYQLSDGITIKIKKYNGVRGILEVNEREYVRKDTGATAISKTYKFKHLNSPTEV